MFGITEIWNYILGVVFIIIIPGANSLYILALGAQQGVRAAHLGILGIAVGDIILMSLSAGGAAALLQTYPNVFSTVKYIGACYLAWLGSQLLYGAWKNWCSVNKSTTSTSKIDTTKEHPFIKGLIIDVLNPHSLMFFFSFFVQFIDPNYAHPFLSFSVLASIMILIGASYLSILAFAGTALATMVEDKPWLTILAESIAGMVFIGFGIKLLLEQ